MGLIEQVIAYDNYTEVDGIKYPFKLTQSFGPQSVEMTVSSVKVNRDLLTIFLQLLNDKEKILCNCF